MYVNITGSKNNKDVYIYQSFRKANGKPSSRIYKKLGKYNELLQKFSGNEEKMMEWARTEAAKETTLYNQQKEQISVTFSQVARIPLEEERLFNVGYLFLQQLCSELRFDNICRNIRNRHRFTYDIHAILTDLIYARILAPSSKMSSYSFCHSLLEPPKYSLQNVYRALSVMAEESDYIQEELYRNSNFVHHRNTKILYYDCTNYYFEIEEESGDKKYGKNKEHRPNSIVTMGLFMDADGIPLAFDIFPGNQNEQLTLKLLETKVIKDFDCSEFIFCSDAGLGSVKNRFLNSFGNRSYVITYSLKKMKQEDREIALNPTQFRLPGSNKMIDLRTLDETDPEVFHTIYYKEVPLVTGSMNETIIVTYSPKYKAYQQKIRGRQVERAMKMIQGPGKCRRGKNQNDPARFIHKTSVTPDGEIADQALYALDEERIREEAMYDGFYAVVTNLEDDPSEIIKINKRRWEIEENFRIMKSDFEARPVYVQRDDRIKAHFLTCYISLLVYRLLEKKLGEEFTCNQILETLRKMNVTLLSKDSGYIPAYKRTKLTDALHNTFKFRIDFEFITKSSMRSIISNTKKATHSKEKI
ncbi:IS1634 family transposase [Anaerosacchariphilus sp. NSJ-68]|uniref:IS1634 family transposase n=2 Tax=Lachnospiraceae TaxID=186803 RepID=A0A923RML8_9FIRM|nr:MULTISPECIES: IS1634 family transposase [Lachnospiraceae]MBC5658540.1 IS1634 family transposase [Anaerosacchariphilus hominis]MBC5698251.1 IS1634 family transposase [Roseburia difficilis]